MKKILIFYGPNREFNKIIPESFYSLEILVEISDYQKRTNRSAGKGINQVVGFTMSYSSITAGGVQNFVSILDEKRDELEEIYLQNPPDCVREEICRRYRQEIIEIKNYQYKRMNRRQLSNFWQQFDGKIIGQPRVKRQMSSTLYELYKNRNKNKPMVIMFYGPSGVGKTETAKYIGKLLGGKICRFQLSMFQTNDFYEYLYGSEHNKGSFAKELLERESNVILFDEFDKAHPGIWSAFYQFFDEGIYKDRNYTVNLSNSIVICTSNEPNPDIVRQKIGDPLFFRINAYIGFDELSDEAKEKICKNIFADEYKSLDKVEKTLIDYNTFLEKYLRVAGKMENYRQIQNIIRNDLSQELVKHMLS